MEEKNSEAAYKQLQTFIILSMSQSHEPAIKLAEKLNEWLGGMLFSSLIVVRKRTKQLLK